MEGSPTAFVRKWQVFRRGKPGRRRPCDGVRAVPVLHERGRQQVIGCAARVALRNAADIFNGKLFGGILGEFAHQCDIRIRHPERAVFRVIHAVIPPAGEGIALQREVRLDIDELTFVICIAVSGNLRLIQTRRGVVVGILHRIGDAVGRQCAPLRVERRIREEGIFRTARDVAVAAAVRLGVPSVKRVAGVDQIGSRVFDVGFQTVFSGFTCGKRFLDVAALRVNVVAKTESGSAPAKSNLI